MAMAYYILIIPTISTEAKQMLPKHVVMIVGASRSGSSLFYHTLRSQFQAMFLDGEEEPYYRLTGNGFGLTSDSDAFTTLHNRERFADLVMHELAEQDPIKRWQHRLSLQFPGKVFDLRDLDPADPVPWLRNNRIYGHYDGAPVDERLPFERDLSLIATQWLYRDFVLEHPPFVMPSQTASQWLHSDILFLKSPANSYRIGALEDAFPNSTFHYIHLTRNFAATVNGLIDGWNAEYGFHSHRLGTNHTGRPWWKFDLPPQWTRYRDKSTANIAFYQWFAAHSQCLRDLFERHTVMVRFEDFLAHPTAILEMVIRHLKLDIKLTNDELILPHTMTTSAPAPRRWTTNKHRAATIRSLAPRAELTMELLGYSMDEKTWT